MQVELFLIWETCFHGIYTILYQWVAYEKLSSFHDNQLTESSTLSHFFLSSVSALRIISDN